MSRHRFSMIVTAADIAAFAYDEAKWIDEQRHGASEAGRAAMARGVRYHDRRKRQVRTVGRYKRRERTAIALARGLALAVAVVLLFLVLRR